MKKSELKLILSKKQDVKITKADKRKKVKFNDVDKIEVIESREVQSSVKPTQTYLQLKAWLNEQEANHPENRASEEIEASLELATENRYISNSRENLLDLDNQEQQGETKEQATQTREMTIEEINEYFAQFGIFSAKNEIKEVESIEFEEDEVNRPENRASEEIEASLELATENRYISNSRENLLDLDNQEQQGETKKQIVQTDDVELIEYFGQETFV